MHLNRVAFAVFATCSVGIHADYLTPTYPAPVDLSSGKSLVSASWDNVTSAFDDFFASSGTHSTSETLLLGIAENVTFSMGMFSLHDPAATELQYHHTGPEIANATRGTNRVDANSIYRVASVSKLITTFTGLVTLSEEVWDRSLADIIPEIGSYAHAHLENLNAINETQWNQITLRTLAAQLSGIATDGWPGGDLSVQLAAIAQDTPEVLKLYGLPPFDPTTLGTCAIQEFCPGPDGAEVVARLPPNFVPWTTPAYSDTGFMLLGLAIANLTGKSISTVYNESVFQPLGMNSTFDTHPVEGVALNHSVISGDPAQNFAIETGFTTPSGGLLSTINDLAKLGIGIMNNTLLCPERTQRWMKPVTHTASQSYSIGEGWEIHRYVHPSTTRVTDMYTKLGDSGFYGGAIVLIPQYNAGFAMLNAYSNQTIRNPAALVILDHITNTILPALEAQAAAEAVSNYVGKYVSTDSTSNSSVTIAFNQSSIPGITSGLTLTSWIFNSTDVLAGPSFMGVKPRLEPSIPKQTSNGSPGQVAFQLSSSIQDLTYMDGMKRPDSGIIGPWTGFFASNGDFVLTDSVRYGGVGNNMFVFDVDAKGRATACSPAVDRVVLTRKED